MPNMAKNTAAAESISKSITVMGFELHIEIRPGDGAKTPLLLMNGLGSRLEVFQPFVDELDPSIEVIRFDAPGVGRSPEPPFPYRFPIAALLLSKVLKKLGYKQVDVLGVSWGGGLAQQFAMQHKAQCRRLVLVSTSTGMLMVPGNPKIMAKMFTPRRYRDPNYMKVIAGELYGGVMRDDPHFLDKVYKKKSGSKPVSRKGYLFQFLATVGWTSLPWLGFISQPTLVLSGKDDPLIPLVNAKLLARQIPKAKLHVFNCGHMGLLTQADSLAPLIGQFLQDSDVVPA